jgi:hypothetical protein
LVSCGGNNNTTIKTKSYEMGIYKVDIPESLQPDSRNMPNFSAWSNEDNFLIIESGDDISYQYMIERYNESVADFETKGFSVLEINRDERSACFKVQKGMFMAKACYVLTECEGTIFLVSYSGSGADPERTKAIANSIQLRIEEVETRATDKKPIFENEWYKIEYPTGWKYMTNPDGVSDVYIGEEDGLFGFSIFHLKAEFTLDDIVENEKNTWKQEGASVKHIKTKVAGEVAYKCIATGMLQGLQIKNVAYSFIHKGVYYNIRFGNDPKLVDENSDIIDEIVDSFQFK